MRASDISILDLHQGLAVGLACPASRSCILKNIFWHRRAEGSMQAQSMLEKALSRQWLP